MELSVVILNWNAAAETIGCVQRLDGWQVIRPTIWVIDNGSTDDSAQAVAAHCPQARLIKNEANLGYAAGNNAGLAAALAYHPAPIMLQNNDAVVAETDVLKLAQALAANPGLGFVGPLLYDADQPDRLLAAGGRNIARAINTHVSIQPGGPAIRVVDYVPGTVLLGQARVFEQVGLLDPAYFFTGEIPDICRRAKQQGFLTAVHPQARAYHALGVSSNRRAALYPYYIIRNRFLFVRKFYARQKIGLFGFWAMYGVALSARLQVGGQIAAARAVRLGVWDGLAGRYGGQNERVLAYTTGAGRL
jgi:hypothetical protein